MTQEIKVLLGTVASVVVLLVGGIFLGAALNGSDSGGSEGGAAPAITTDLRNNMYKDGTTIKFNPTSLTLATNILTNDNSATFTGTHSTSGTTTVDQSPDGFTIGGTFSRTATDTPITVYTHSGPPAMCDSDTAFLRIQNNGLFSPAFGYSLSKNTAGAADLVASSTNATTTTANTEFTEALFRFAPGDTMVAMFNDDDHSQASSTHWSSDELEAGMWCQSLSI